MGGWSQFCPGRRAAGGLGGLAEGRKMRRSTGLALVAIGAILAFAVHAQLAILNLKLTGVVLMITGLAGLQAPQRAYRCCAATRLSSGMPWTGSWRRRRNVRPGCRWTPCCSRSLPPQHHREGTADRPSDFRATASRRWLPAVCLKNGAHGTCGHGRDPRRSRVMALESRRYRCAPGRSFFWYGWLLARLPLGSATITATRGRTARTRGLSR